LAQGIAQYALARRLRPDDVATSEELAADLTHQEQSPAALPSVREALDLLPTAEMRAQLAGAWAGQGKFQYSLQAYRAALALQPESPEILNNLAWLLATCPEAAIRNGAQAVQLAERACTLTRFRQAVMVGTLAAAYAEAGRFAEAVATAQKARALAAQSGDAPLERRNQQLLEQYRAGQPHREAAKPTPPPPALPHP
jgi:Flp pilus assembly protein TadD